jgi:hypothetical protein
MATQEKTAGLLRRLKRALNLPGRQFDPRVIPDRFMLPIVERISARDDDGDARHSIQHIIPPDSKSGTLAGK